MSLPSAVMRSVSTIRGFTSVPISLLAGTVMIRLPAVMLAVPSALVPAVIAPSALRSSCPFTVRSSTRRSPELLICASPETVPLMLFTSVSTCTSPPRALMSRLSPEITLSEVMPPVLPSASLASSGLVIVPMCISPLSDRFTSPSAETFVLPPTSVSRALLPVPMAPPAMRFRSPPVLMEGSSALAFSRAASAAS